MAILDEFEDTLLDKFDRPDIVEIGQSIPDLAKRFNYYAEITPTITHADIEQAKYRFPPVSCEQFLDDPYYLGGISSPWPVVRAEVIEACSGKYVEAVFTGSIGCVDGNTEYLTPTGWKSIDSWVTGTKVAQYDKEAKEISFIAPEYHVFPASKFYHLKTKYGVDQMLSPEHRVLYLDKAGSPKVIVAEDLYKAHCKNKQGFGGKFITTFRVPAIGGLSLSEHEIRVQIMTQADGHINNKISATLSFKKARKIKRARMLLNNADIPYREYVCSGYTRFYYKPPLVTKNLDLFWEASSKQLSIVIDEARNWDARYTTGKSIYSTDKSVIDLLQYAAASSGWRASIKVDAREGRASCYILQLSTSINPTIMGTPKTNIEVIQDTKNKKYCFTVPKTFWLARRNGNIFVTGNTGKTTAAILVTAYNLYLILNLIDPHVEFDMDKSSEISFIMQSITGGTAFTVDYMRLRRTLEGSPWFRANAPHDKDLKASIKFHNSVIVVEPLPGTETAAIGENVMGGMIDEVNHMKVIQGSSRTKDNGTWDQMLENYRAIARRRESRFLREGRVLGMLCLVGSANYAGQFTDKKKDERDKQIARTGKTNIYIYDKRPWEVQPEGRFSSDYFKVFTGDGTRKPYIIPLNEKIHVNDQPFIMEVPMDYYGPFENDLSGAIKDIAGIALHGFSNFISNYSKINDAFGKRKNIFNPDWCNFHNQPAVIVDHSIINPAAKRYVHLDLSLQVDYAALAMGHCSGFNKIDRGGGMIDYLPEITIDALLTIKPTGGSQIPIHKLKKIIFTLKKMGYPISWVSLDGFQSADFIQTMRRNGFRSGVVSLDRTPEPYMLAKQLILDGQVQGPQNDLMQKELRELVWVSHNSKVDHPPDGSKDLADAATGVLYGLASKRETWVAYGIDPSTSSVMTKEGV